VSVSETQPKAAKTASGQSRVAVVITNYNTWPLTQRCVNHVERFGKGVDEIVVVDDASSDPVPEALAKKAYISRNPRNLGFVRSLNRGIRTTTADYVVLFDSDAFPITPFANEVRETFKSDARIGVVGFETIDRFGRPSGSWEPEPGLLSLVLGQRLYGGYLKLRGKNPDGPISVFAGAMAVRRSAFDQIGGFDEAFDWLELDHDFCLRLRRAGWKVRRLPEVQAFHEAGGTPQTTKARVVRSFTNRWLLLRKAGKIPWPTVTRFLLAVRVAAEYGLARLLAMRRGSTGRRFLDVCEGRRRILQFLLKKAR
jgi:GT2 family glycosyltransferase